MNAVQHRAALLRPLRLPRLNQSTVYIGAIACAALAGAIAANHPPSYRLVLAVALGANLLIVASRWPRPAVFLTLALLCFLALIRRFLIADAGWTSYDPLLLVAPIVATFVIARLFLLERREPAPDRPSRLVFALLALTIIQSFNPLLGGLAAGAGGFMFLGFPLLWFFIGRELADRRFVLLLLYCVTGLGMAIGAYGLWQTEIGLPSWDDAWVHLGGYEALNVYGVTRAFGTFSSSAEYGVFLGMAIAISVAMLLHRRGIFSLAIPFLAVSVFFASGRTVLVLSVFAAFVLAGLRTRSMRLAIVIVVVGLIATAGAVRTYAPVTQSLYTSSQPLATHQFAGLTNPLNPEQSTLLVHVDAAIGGIVQGITHPFGQGTAVTNIAADRFGIGSSAKGTEVDVSNAFVSLGLLGGLLFVALVVMTFYRIVSSYLAHPDPVLLAIIGVLIVSAGQWLNGGHYALAPLTWLLIGWATTESERRDRVPRQVSQAQVSKPASTRVGDGANE